MTARFTMRYGEGEQDLIGPHLVMVGLISDRVAHLLPGETITITREVDR